MPTKLDRVQVLFRKELFLKLKLIAKIERRSLSRMVSSMVEDSIESPKYQSLLSRAKTNDLNAKIDEGRLLISDIVNSNLVNEIDFDLNSKLKKIDEILTTISKTSQNENKNSLLENSYLEDFSVDDILVPRTELKKINSDTEKKLQKLRGMLAKVKKK